MTTAKTITQDSLMTLEAYAKIRKSSAPQVIAHRKLRTVHLGEHISVQFEDEQTIRRQIQEMLHIEKIFDEDGIRSEIDAYAALLPDGSNWKATMLIEYPDVHERKRELARLIGVEDRMFVEGEDHARIYAIADEDLDRENDEKTSACTSCASSSARRRATRCARARSSSSAAITRIIRCMWRSHPTRWPASPATWCSARTRQAGTGAAADCRALRQPSAL